MVGIQKSVAANQQPYKYYHHHYTTYYHVVGITDFYFFIFQL